MNLFVIIVTYNGDRWIERCLRSVYEATIEAIPIVLDNGSADGTLDIIRKKFPQCQLIETGANLGFGRANNMGIRKAIKQDAEYIYLLNQDAWVDPDCFEQIIKVHKEHPDYGILSPIQLTGDGMHADHNFLDKFIEAGTYKDYLKDVLANNCSDLYQTGLVMAAHWLLYVPDLKKIGLFSPTFAHYGEDYNLISRYRFYGKKVGICVKAKGYHDREYRNTMPEKKAYITYYIYKRQLNDPNKNTVSRMKEYLRLCNRMRKNTSSISLRLQYLITGLKEFSIAKKYRKIYKQSDCFEQLKDLE